MIVLWYLLLGVATFITVVSFGILFILIEEILIFVLDFSILTQIDNWFNNYGINETGRFFLIIPLILFFLRPALAEWSKEDLKEKISIYNPFSDWGNLIYMKRHKEFYEKYYTNDYIKWKKEEEKKKRNKRRK
tara:strand:+ start:69 stop:467 length:399 start_codon:yes stop_codon:yes gene_type:complete